MGLSRTAFRNGATDSQGVRLQIDSNCNPRNQRKSRRTTMLRKLTIVLAAAASLSVAALAPSTASAKPFGGWGWGGFHHRHFGGFGMGVGYVDDGCYVTRRVLTPYGYRFRTVNVCAY
jgi:hypothetical protein